MTALEFYDKRCPAGRGQLLGRTVIAPDGRAGVIVSSEWGPGDALWLRLRPPGSPAPSWRKADGTEPTGRYRVLSAADLANGSEVNGENCWKAPAADCRMPKRQPVWS